MRPHSRLRLQRRIAEFYEYKTKDKGVILAEQLKLEALFNNLAMRLAHHKRPEYVPPPGCSLKVPYPIPRSLVLSHALSRPFLVVSRMSSMLLRTWRSASRSARLLSMPSSTGTFSLSLPPSLPPSRSVTR